MLVALLVKSLKEEVEEEAKVRKQFSKKSQKGGIKASSVVKAITIKAEAP